MESTVPSPVMNWNSENLPDAWKRFRQHADLMFSGPLLSKSEAEKVSYLLIWVGEKGRDIHNTFSNITEQNRDKLETYYTNYEQYVTPKSNKVFARFKFHTRVQTPADTFDAFVTDLKLLVQECGYADPDEMVRDRIVFGVSSPKIREKLISVGSDLTLRKAVEIAHTVELSQTQLKTMAGESSAASSVNSIKTGQTKFYKNCYFCGRDHSKGQCPAFGTTCSKCGMKNHWTKQCEIASQHSHRPKSRSREQHKAGHKPRRGSRSRFSHNRKKSPTQVHQVKNESETDSDSFCIYSVSNQKKSRLEAKLKVKDTKAILVAQVDTGAGVNLLPIRCFKQLYPDDMLPNGKPDLENSTITPKTSYYFRPQCFYFLFYGFSGPISDVGGRKKIKNKI